MDLGPSAYYVAFSMELLLILSAMLSAVTGAFTGVCGPEAQVHRAESAVGAQLAASAVQQEAREARTPRPASLPLPTEVEPLPDFAIVAAAPLATDRLIE